MKYRNVATKTLEDVTPPVVYITSQGKVMISIGDFEFEANAKDADEFAERLMDAAHALRLMGLR